MSEQEFLNILRESLQGDLPENEINENISYYRNYINQAMETKSEDAVIHELGDPRLIARTITETYQRNHGADKFYHKTNYQEPKTQKEHSNQGRIFTLSGRAAGIIALIILFVILGVVLAIGGFVLSIVLRFFFPILGIVLLVTLFRELFRRR